MLLKTLYNFHNFALNLRHYNVSKINVTSSGKRNKIKIYNLL